MSKFASLCLLSYNRPQNLIDCLNSLEATIDFPCEIIINSDGGDLAHNIAYNKWMIEKASKLILSKGKNRGVGRSFLNCLGVAEGDYMFKIDADLTFQPHWISKAIKILDTDPTIASVGLFDYNKWDPNDERFKAEENVLENVTLGDFEYQIVKDYVSSIYAFRKKDKIRFEGLDDGFHQKLNGYGKLALLHQVENTAFGVGKSTYVSGTMDHPIKTPTFEEPLLFPREPYGVTYQ